jgi:hypothetical protein
MSLARDVLVKQRQELLIPVFERSGIEVARQYAKAIAGYCLRER